MRLSSFVIHGETKTITGLSSTSVSVTDADKLSGGFESVSSTATDNIEIFTGTTADSGGTYTANLEFSALQEEAATADFIVIIEKNYRG